MKDYEKPGTFYLGRKYDLSAGETGDTLLYDSKDLVTHAVCVGMTGSGKTGLCIGLLEEATLGGIPIIAIDPKGDLTNLLLTFPELRAEDFRPWVTQEEASKQDLTLDDFAQQQAELWERGLADWGQDRSRIGRLKAAADFSIYTPGSTAGLPVSILKSFAAPAPAVRKDREALRDRINTAMTGLLGLVGVEADPIQSREHILLSTLCESAWSAGQDLDLARLIRQIQEPPFTQVGVLDLESFYPAKDRSELAMLLNNLLAAPTFQTWLEGDVLDIGRMLFGEGGKPRVSIFSIAHLSDAERMFFVSLLLNEVLGWMRAQPGSGSLRALLYMDEIFGFFPPVAEPPSKRPLLTLLKQARAFGVGVLLATQNPVDLDYKGLANTGTWFIGRLQTDRDKKRLLEGLEGVAVGSEATFDRQEMEETLAGLGKRVFLMYNVHQDAPATFQTRWAMSYLAGPLTRAQIKTLMDPRRSVTEAPDSATSATPTPTSAHPVNDTAVAAFGDVAPASEAPVLPAEIPQYYLPLRGATQADSTLVYQAGVLAAATISFVSRKTGASTSTKLRRIAEAPETALTLDWEQAVELEATLEELDRRPYPDATFAPLPAAMAKVASYRSWGSRFSDWAYRTQTAELLKSPGLKLTSDPGENEDEFRDRLESAARDKRDKQAEALRKKYEGKIARVERQMLRAKQAVERESEQARGRKLQTAISLGATVLSAIVGRRPFSSGTVGRATTAMRDVGRSIDQSGDVKRAEETLGSLDKKREDLEAELQEQLDALEGRLDSATENLETVLMRPRKSDITVDSLGLVWMPYWRSISGSLTGAWE